jgi:methylenetetrahydrofolate reductase (NADPH)
VLDGLHRHLFVADAPLAAGCRRMARWLDRTPTRRRTVHLLEAFGKTILLKCRQCGDCAIAHTAYLCPESQCPKHTRNGPCGGSRDGRCEVVTERSCVWSRAYLRYAFYTRTGEMASDCIPPRMWELERTASWLNFHLGRDHQGADNGLSAMCRSSACRLPSLQR